MFGGGWEKIVQFDYFVVLVEVINIVDTSFGPLSELMDALTLLICEKSYIIARALPKLYRHK